MRLDHLLSKEIKLKSEEESKALKDRQEEERRSLDRCLIFSAQKHWGTQRTAELHGGVAQLGEHLPCKQGVKGSNPFISTTPKIHIGS